MSTADYAVLVLWCVLMLAGLGLGALASIQSQPLTRCKQKGMINNE